MWLDTSLFVLLSLTPMLLFYQIKLFLIVIEISLAITDEVCLDSKCYDKIFKYQNIWIIPPQTGPLPSHMIGKFVYQAEFCFSNKSETLTLILMKNKIVFVIISGIYWVWCILGSLRHRFWNTKRKIMTLANIQKSYHVKMVALVEIVASMMIDD